MRASGRACAAGLKGGKSVRFFRKKLKLVKGQEGFTLIELLIVVAIIGIMVAIVVPRVGEALDNSKKKAARGTAQNLHYAMERYFMDKNRYPTEDEMETQENPDYDKLRNNLLNYVTLPSDKEAAPFEFSSYTADGDKPTDYTLTITARDRKPTVYEISPEGVNEQQ